MSLLCFFYIISGSSIFNRKKENFENAQFKFVKLPNTAFRKGIKGYSNSELRPAL